MDTEHCGLSRSLVPRCREFTMVVSASEADTGVSYLLSVPNRLFINIEKDGFRLTLTPPASAYGAIQAVGTSQSVGRSPIVSSPERGAHGSSREQRVGGSWPSEH